MPPRAQTTARRDAHTAPLPHSRPRAVTGRLPRSRVGWDRKFRIVLILVVGLIGWIGLKAGLALVAAHAQAAAETRLVVSLQRQHSALLAQERSLYQKATIIRDARRLGMVAAGERPFVVVNLGR